MVFVSAMSSSPPEYSRSRSVWAKQCGLRRGRNALDKPPIEGRRSNGRRRRKERGGGIYEDNGKKNVGRIYEDEEKKEEGRAIDEDEVKKREDKTLNYMK